MEIKPPVAIKPPVRLSYYGFSEDTTKVAIRDSHGWEIWVKTHEEAAQIVEALNERGEGPDCDNCDANLMSQMYDADYPRVSGENAALTEKVERYRAVLRFYSNIKGYYQMTRKHDRVMHDKGRRARAALAGSDKAIDDAKP